MTDPSLSPTEPHTRTDPRKFVVWLAAANTLFWVWTFYFIGSHTNPKGDGMEWLAVVPFGFIFFVGVLLPVALSGGFSAIIRNDSKTAGDIGARIAFLVMFGATIANALIYWQIAGEFASHAK